MNTAFLPVRRRRLRKRLHTISAESDEAILGRYQQTRRREDFAQLVYRYERELFNYLRRYLGDAESAEDVFQSTFLQVHLNCEQFQADRRFRPWLYCIATNQAIDLQRKNRRYKALSLDRTTENEEADLGSLLSLLAGNTPSPIKLVGDAEQAQWVREALQRLPEPFRAVVHLAYYQGMTYVEVAEALSIPVGTVRSRLHSAVAKLHDMWNTQFRDSP